MPIRTLWVGALTVGLAVGIHACAEAPESTDVASRFRTAASTRDTIILSEVASFAWDRVCIVGPHTSRARASEIAGFRVPRSAATLLAEDANILIFANKGKLAEYASIRRDIDLIESAGKCANREEATLIRSGIGGGGEPQFGFTSPSKR